MIIAWGRSKVHCTALLGQPAESQSSQWIYTVITAQHTARCTVSTIRPIHRNRQTHARKKQQTTIRLRSTPIPSVYRMRHQSRVKTTPSTHGGLARGRVVFGGKEENAAKERQHAQKLLKCLLAVCVRVSMEYRASRRERNVLALLQISSRPGFGCENKRQPLGYSTTDSIPQ